MSSFNDEQWKPLHEGFQDPQAYRISNYGRVWSYQNSEEGRELTQRWVNDYKAVWLPKKNGKRSTFYVHRLVAEHFIEKERPEQNIVLHLDFNKGNNYYKNLKWATRAEMEEHHMDNEKYVNRFLRNEHENKGKRTNATLKPTEVKLIKRKLNDPERKTRIKTLARMFGVSEMQIYRIQSGENWADVHPENEPTSESEG